MKKFKIIFTQIESQGYSVEVKANSKKKAKEVFNENVYSLEWKEEKNTYEGRGIEENISIEQII